MTMSAVEVAKRRVTLEPNYFPAPMPATVRVEDSVCIEVIDNGRGGPGGITGRGLTGLRHRAQRAGGALSIADVPGGGTVLRC